MEGASEKGERLRTTLLMCQATLAEVFSSQTPKHLNTRDTLLLASIAKALRTSEAIEYLDKLHQFPCEMIALCRGLAELSINAGYFQRCEVEEIRRYFDQGVRSTARSYKQMIDLHPDMDRLLTPEEQASLEQKIEDVRNRPDAHNKDTEWSIRDLYGRATQLDDWMGMPLGKSLHRTVFGIGNTFVHQNVSSLDPFLRYIKEATFDESLMSGFTEIALYGAAICLYLLIHIYAWKYDVDLSDRIKAIHQIMGSIE